MKKLIVANWKMYLTLRQSVTVAKRISNFQFPISKIELVLCPSFVALPEVEKVLHRTRIKLGAQDVEPESHGAYTGAVGLDDLAEIGVQYVLLGHSERRQRFGETDAIVNKKLRAVLKVGMRPILCVGEPWSVRRSRGEGGARKYVQAQVKAGLCGVSKRDLGRVIIAYEPVWAISGGGGHADTPEGASAMHVHIRSVLHSTRVPILYGGSVNARNAAGFFQAAEIDGLLVGSASTKASEFLSIMRIV